MEQKSIHALLFPLFLHRNIYFTCVADTITHVILTWDFFAGHSHYKLLFIITPEAFEDVDLGLLT